MLVDDYHYMQRNLAHDEHFANNLRMRMKKDPLIVEARAANNFNTTAKMASKARPREVGLNVKARVEV